jgi:WW domain-containing oxidoreductase
MPGNKRSTAEAITESIDLSGKTALVTGVNSGIGTETMRVLALRGARVLGTARTLEKAQAACAEVAGEVIPLACELTDLDSVRACIDAVNQHTDQLDILIANAGIMALPKLEQVRALEMQFATNHVGHFLLVTGLMDLLAKSERARVVMVSSDGHRAAPKAGIEFDNLSGEKGYSALRAYGQSKLANILFANELGRRLPAGATANSLHPGVIQTNLGRHINPILASVLGLFFVFASKTVPQGAATSCYVAAHPELEGVTGRYFSDCDVKAPSAIASDEALAARLWEVSEELVRE